ncbi:hypothetical protein DY245_18065 [Streptomyces inhibens]|uniref:Uncharacterized protein n=1 Tax=Streptomyces inhibens TaxID=2293571 RepID=A0A371Q2T2_STRIH|nr:hypothetical protein [Streptomyces inhibens]REK88999.1 hypothetical protein DY245_18065 [Streptomyces inhibens]
MSVRVGTSRTAANRLCGELATRGCPAADLAAATRILFPAGWAPRAPVGFDVQLMARAVLEDVLRDRVTALAPVTFRYGLHAEHLLPGPRLHRSGGQVAQE